MSLDIKRWRKRPVVVDAVRFTGFGPGGNGDELLAWLQDQGVRTMGEGRELMIETLEGDIWARPGDYVVRGTAGELYPVKEHIFRDIYEPAS